MTQILNTRLFPKRKGVKAYNLTGIAARCDWAIMTDRKTEEGFVKGALDKSPKTVFLSLRSLFAALPYFYNEILPKIYEPFVLITGSEDITLPNQIDARWRVFNHDEREIIRLILDDYRLIHWFAENLDEENDKMSAIPLGYVFVNNESEWIEIEEPVSLLKDRPLRVFCSHRVREGPQWEPRRLVTNLCKNEFSRFVTVCDRKIDSNTFKQQVKNHPFTLCVQGGGLDPSPKAWMAIVNGSIPIIKSSPLDKAYSQLPVVIINEWNKEALSLTKLSSWLNVLAPYYNNKILRKKVVFRLSMDFWWKKIIDSYYSKFEPHSDDTFIAITNSINQQYSNK